MLVPNNLTRVLEPVELARHGVEHGAGRESEGQFDLEPEPDPVFGTSGTSKAWGRVWSQEGIGGSV